MLRVGICDDEKAHREEIYDLALHAIFAYDDAEFKFYSSGQSVIDEIENNKFLCDLLFMDIHMPGKDGLETAKYIRDYNVDVDIIFVTVSEEHVFDGYTYRAFSYIVKPVKPARLEEEIGRYMTERLSAAQCLHVTINNRKELLYLNQVYYFEGDARKVRCYQKKEIQEFYAKMGDLEQMLGQYGFIRCHQSYLVNKKYIEKSTRTSLIVSGKEIPVSRKYLDSVRKELQ